QKRWADLDRVTLTAALAVAADPETMLPAIDEALARLATIDPEQAKIVELRYFMGLGIEETADVLGLSPATLKRRWALARAGRARRPLPGRPRARERRDGPGVPRDGHTTRPSRRAEGARATSDGRLLASRAAAA